MTQYDVTYRVGDIINTRTLSLAEATTEAAIKELLRRGLISADSEVEILSFEERFGMC